MNLELVLTFWVECDIIRVEARFLGLCNFIILFERGIENGQNTRTDGTRTP